MFAKPLCIKHLTVFMGIFRLDRYKSYDNSSDSLERVLICWFQKASYLRHGDRGAVKRRGEAVDYLVVEIGVGL